MSLILLLPRIISVMNFLCCTKYRLGIILPFFIIIYKSLWWIYVVECGDYFRKEKKTENRPCWCDSSLGNRQEMLICQTNSAQRVLCDDSRIGVYHPQTACVSTINTRHAPCLGKQAPRLTTAAKSSSVNTLWAAFPPSLLLMLYFRIKTSKFCVALTHLKQSAPLCNVMAFQCCDIIRMHMCAHACFIYVCVGVCVSTLHWCWQHSWEADIIHRSVLTCPHLTKRLFFIHHEGE